MVNIKKTLGLCLSIGAALSTLHSLDASSAQASTLYKLNTECSFKGGAAVPCTVEASQAGQSTIYRHTAGNRVITIRVSDEPSRIELMNPATGQFSTVNSAGARFSVNTICYNGRDFCVVNPNYLNSIREASPQQFAGRDLVRVKMNKAGRIILTCYDEGCDSIQ